MSLLLLLRYWLLQAAAQPRCSSALAALLWAEIRGGDGCREKTRLELKAALQRALSEAGDDGLAAAELLRCWLCELRALRTPDAVCSLFASLHSLLLLKPAAGEQGPALGQQLQLDGRSVFGLFLRHQLWLFNVGLFSSPARLHQQILAYAEDRQGDGQRSSGSSGSSGSGTGGIAAPSAAQLQLFVRRQADRLQSLVGRQSAQALDGISRQLEAAAAVAAAASCGSHLLSPASASVAAAASRLRCLVALCRSDYTEALSCSQAAADQGEPELAACSASLLELATLQARFGHAELAVELLDDCVRVAQQQQEQGALQQALQLLTAVCLQQPAASSLADRCALIQRAALQGQARRVEDWRAGGGAAQPPALGQLEATLAANALALVHTAAALPAASSSPSPAAVWSSLAGAASLSSLYSLEQAAAAERQLRAAAWAAFGSRQLSALSRQVHWLLSAARCPASDAVSSLHSLAADGQQTAAGQAAILALARRESAQSPARPPAASPRLCLTVSCCALLQVPASV